MADANPSRPDKNVIVDPDKFEAKGAEKIVEKNGRKYTSVKSANGLEIRTFIDGKKA